MNQSGASGFPESAGLLTGQVEWTDDATALYRLYDGSGVLLYVGIARNVAFRFAHHAAEQSWWHEVARKTVTWYAGRQLADGAETAAIAAERPRHNVAKRPGPVSAPGLTPAGNETAAAKRERALAELPIVLATVRRELEAAGHKLPLAAWPERTEMLNRAQVRIGQLLRLLGENWHRWLAASDLCQLCEGMPRSVGEERGCHVCVGTGLSLEPAA